MFIWHLVPQNVAKGLRHVVKASCYWMDITKENYGHLTPGPTKCNPRSYVMLWRLVVVTKLDTEKENYAHTTPGPTEHSQRAMSCCEGLLLLLNGHLKKKHLRPYVGSVVNTIEMWSFRWKTKKNCHFDFLWFLHFNFDSKTKKNDDWRDAQLLMRWDKSQFNSTARIVCGVGSATHRLLGPP